MKTVLLLTEAYPLGGITEEAFVKPEIEALSKVFDRVVVVPVSERGPMAPMPASNVVVARDVIDSVVWRRKWMRVPVHLSAILRGRDDVRYALSAATVESSLKTIISRMKLSASDTVMEAFWFDFAASALAGINRKFGFRYRVRAHRYDVYTQRAPSQRGRAIAMSDGVRAVSHSGAEYLRSRFPMAARKISTAYLGVESEVEESRHSSVAEKAVCLLTVARITDIKRCDLCFEFANALATARPQWKFEWTLIGSGPEEASLRALVESGCRSNLKVRFLGEMSHEAVMDYYASSTTDWFMLLSRSEGLSVAMLEAMAHGVPVIATDVGGTAEAVDDSTGLLLAPDPEPEEFVRGLMPYLDSRARYDAICSGARQRVKEMFDVRELRNEWARDLKSLLE